MRIETYIPGLSKNTVDIVKHAESLGYDALVSGELYTTYFFQKVQAPRSHICIRLSAITLSDKIQ